MPYLCRLNTGVACGLYIFKVGCTILVVRVGQPVSVSSQPNVILAYHDVATVNDIVTITLVS